MAFDCIAILQYRSEQENLDGSYAVLDEDLGFEGSASEALDLVDCVSLPWNDACEVVDVDVCC